MQDLQHDINYWPQEVLLAFFNNLDLAFIGTCAGVCKKWFQMSKDNELWRQKCVENWSLLPKEKDCKRNWLIPTKDGDALIDWRRVYAIKKTWPDVIKCLQQYYDVFDQKPLHRGKKSQKATIKKLLDRVAKKEWITLTDFKQMANFALQYIEEKFWDLDVNQNYPIDPECIDNMIQFFLKVDLVMISRSNATRVKQTGLGLRFINASQERPNEIENISFSLLWAAVRYAREYVYQLEKKGLDQLQGINLLFQVVSLFYNSSLRERLEKRSLDLLPELINLVLHAINTWNIEAEMVFQDSAMRQIEYLIQNLCYMLKMENFSVMDVFIERFKPISPPKTARDALTLVYLKNLLQNLLHEPEEIEKMRDWYNALPTPTGSTQDKTLILYHYEVLKDTDLSRPCEDLKINAACDFLLEALLDLDKKLKTKVMDKLLLHDNVYCLLLTEVQQQILFDKLKKMGEDSPELKDQADKWTVKLAIGCERISEYKELIIATITDPANRELLGMNAFSNTELLKAAMEEYQRDPKDATEIMLLKFGEEINMIRKEQLPENFISFIISIIGKRIAEIRAENNPNEDIPEEDSVDLESVDEEGSFDEDEEDDEEDDEISRDEMEDDENMDGEGVNVDRMEFSSDESENFETDYGTRELLTLLTTVVTRLTNDEIIKDLPQILSILKTEYNNLRLPNFYQAIISTFLPSQAKTTDIADPLAASVVDWIRNTIVNEQNIDPESFSNALKILLNACSKNFLTTDVVSKLLAWVNGGLEEGMTEFMELWALLATRAEDPTEPTNLLYQKLETMLKSDDDAQLRSGMTYMIYLLQADAFKNPKLVPLLEIVWKVRLSNLHDGTETTYIEFIGAAALHFPSTVIEHLSDTLNFFEKQRNAELSTAALTPNYALVIALIEDPSLWLHHMKILIETFMLSEFFDSAHTARELGKILEVFYKLLEPTHPLHKKLLEEDPALEPKIHQILSRLEEYKRER